MKYRLCHGTQAYGKNRQGFLSPFHQGHGMETLEWYPCLSHSTSYHAAHQIPIFP